MEIGGLQKLTLIDYPGRLAATVFLIGCNFHCPFCYSKELVLPKETKKQPRISEKDFFSFLKKRKGLLEGVCVTGGEPTVHRELPNFIEKIKKLGYLVKLDTNGSNPKILKDLIDKKLIDYVAMDVKAPLKNQKSKSSTDPHSKNQNDKLKFKKNKYEQATGVKVDLEDIKKSIEIIKSSGIDYEFRTTVLPILHTKRDIIQIAKEISPAEKYFLQNFKPEKTLNPKYEKCKPFSQEELESIQKECNKYVLTQLRN